MKIKKIICFIIVSGVIAAYYASAESIVTAVKEAMMICYNTVIPSLFIFMIISSVISSSVYADILSFPFIPFFRLLNINNRRIMTYCILSMLGGFGNGGYFLNRINNEIPCDDNLRYVLTVLTSCNSPSFVIIAVGMQMFGNIKTGILIYIAMIISCYITAFILSFIFSYSTVPDTAQSCGRANITDAIKSSVSAILNICGVIILVFTLCKVASLYTQNSAVSVVFSVFTEVTTACSMIYSEYGSNLYMMCAAVTVFPLSAYFQMKSFDEKGVTDFKVLFISKLFQTPLCIAILRILVNLFPVSYGVYASGDICVRMYWNAPRISCCMLLMSVCFVAVFDKKIGVFTKLRK